MNDATATRVEELYTQGCSQEKISRLLDISMRLVAKILKAGCVAGK